MPADPPDLGFVMLLLGLRHAVAIAEAMAARWPEDQVLAGVLANLRAAVAQAEAHPNAPRAGGG